MNSEIIKIINKNNKANVNVLDISADKDEGIFSFAKQLGFNIAIAVFEENCDFDAVIIADDNNHSELNNKILVNCKYPLAYKEFLISYLLADFLLHGKNQCYISKFYKSKKMDVEILKVANDILISSIQNESSSNKIKKLRKNGGKK